MLFYKLNIAFCLFNVISFYRRYNEAFEELKNASGTGMLLEQDILRDINERLRKYRGLIQIEEEKEDAKDDLAN